MPLPFGTIGAQRTLSLVREVDVRARAVELGVNLAFAWLTESPVAFVGGRKPAGSGLVRANRSRPGDLSVWGRIQVKGEGRGVGFERTNIGSARYADRGFQFLQPLTSVSSFFRRAHVHSVAPRLRVYRPNRR